MDELDRELADVVGDHSAELLADLIDDPSTADPLFTAGLFAPVSAEQHDRSAASEAAVGVAAVVAAAAAVSCAGLGRTMGRTCCWARGSCGLRAA